MRASLLCCSAALVLAAFCLSSAQESNPGKAARPADSNGSGKTETQRGKSGEAHATQKVAPGTARKPASEVRTEKPAAGDQRSPDEDAIRQTAETFIRAYEAGDAKAAAGHFTANAEYVDEEGNVFTGRDEIERNLARFFADNAGARLEISIDSIRFVDPAVAIEDGSTTIVRRDGTVRAHSRYVAMHAKSGGKWQVATVREHAPRGERRHREQLQQLEWLVGEWIDEADESIVTFTCRPVDGGTFLLREFNVTVAGDEVISGSQRIGWDPITGRLRAWTFDSQGGHFEGVWHRDGDSWVLNSTGVTADGETASGTSIFTFVNPHTVTWQAVNHELEGVRMADSELYTLVRRGPPPDVSDRETK